MMDIRPIKTESDYEKVLSRIAELMDAKLNSPEGDELEVLSTLVDAYESRQFPIESADPVAGESIQFVKGLIMALKMKEITRRSIQQQVLEEFARTKGVTKDTAMEAEQK